MERQRIDASNLVEQTMLIRPESLGALLMSTLLWIIAVYFSPFVCNFVASFVIGFHNAATCSIA